MVNLTERDRIIDLLSQKYGKKLKVQDSSLLRLFATMKAMYDTEIKQPERAYETVLAKYSTYQYGYTSKNSGMSPIFFYDVWPNISNLSFLDFLTYVVPGIACDPKRTLAIFQKYIPAFGCIEQTHHILQIKLVAEKMKKQKSKEKNGIDQLYSIYLEQEKYHILEKEVFKKLHMAINAFEMRPPELSPKHQGAGFTLSQLTELMDILTNKLQMTRAQQIDMIAEYFVKKQQARQIINNQQLYNFTACKDENTRVQLATKALRLITKIPPMESICAISIQKKSEGKTNTKRKTEAQILPNDITLEIGMIYPVFRQLIGAQKDAEILLVYPSIHFVRKLWEDETLRGRNIILVMQHENVASLLQYQANDGTYAFDFPSTRIMGPKSFEEQVENKNLPYEKILFFGNHLQVEAQQSEIGDILSAINAGCEVYALLSAYAIEDKSSLKGSALQHYAEYLHAISIIPQGINNGTFPRRKLWCHFVKNDAVLEAAVTKVSAYTLNTDLQAQVLFPSREPPIEIPRSDFATTESSVRKLYSKELLLRNATDRTRTLPFVHEITPDIPVWCSRTFPKGEDENPRLEAYICLPPSEGDAYQGFSERGTIIQSTKKHTTGVAQSGVLNWLENEYPISYIQPRYSRAEREQLDTKQEPKPVFSIREEIIENYLPLLEKENIALKTLWYLYPDLRNVYTGSDYNMLSSMMKTIIGQQRVCDITSELCEKLLMEVYPELNETALWRNYTILSIAMEKAVRCGYCKSNPLADALYEEKLRRKLFAQVRKQLAKKHLNRNQIKKAYASVVAKLQNGQHAYLGVWLRLLTGLESNIVCALRWGDMFTFEDVDQPSLVITRQVSNDGKKLSGFSDKEDYMLFPLSDGLRDLLFAYKQRLSVVAEQEPILSSVMRLCTEGAPVVITPAVLNGYVKEILKELNIEDYIIDLAYGENEFRKTNLNKYMGDLMRENFRYWATKEAKLSPDELEYLLRNRVASTCGRFYCNLEDGTSLAIIATKLNRMECLFSQSSEPRAYRKRKEQITQYVETSQNKNGYRQIVSIEIKNTEGVELCVYSPRGVFCETTELSEKDGEIKQ